MINFLNKGTQITIDLFVLSVAYWLAFYFRFEFALQFQMYKLIFFTWPYIVVMQYLLLITFGVPKIAWRYVGLQEVKRIILPLLIAAFILTILRVSMAHVGGYTQFVVVPLSVIFINFTLAFLGIAGARVLRRMLTEREERTRHKGSVQTTPKRTLLIGAGRAGVLVAKEVAQNPHLGIKVVGFVDDETTKIGTIIQGHTILGDTASIKLIAKKVNAEQAIISIAAIGGNTVRSIVKQCEATDLPVKIIPGIYDIIGGKVNLSRIREVTISDLLGRKPVQLDVNAIETFITNKRVLVTGAGGSIGSEACRQICKYNPAQLLLVEQAENSLYHIHRELINTYPTLNVIPCIADIADSMRVKELFKQFTPQVVFHAAAHKHVPMMEWNPGEAIKNNVFGTRKVADAADEYGAEAFVMISTDKAVNPTSIMGTTKRCAELYIQGISQASKTKFVAVRFGNVLGSAGSVIPLFKEQIAKGGPVTVTHPKMRRYFMTIPEACQLVMQAATMGRSGDIFVLDMGEPVYISALAKDLIHLSGFTQDEIEIQYTGLRPGEKMFEELAVDGEKITKTRHPKIFIGKIESSPLEEVNQKLERLHECTNCMDNDHIRACLKKIVPEMLPPDEG